MKLNPESLAKASSRHPWRTVGAWVGLIVLMGVVSARLLTGVLTDDMAFTNEPEAAQGAEGDRREVRRGGGVHGVLRRAIRRVRGTSGSPPTSRT